MPNLLTLAEEMRRVMAAAHKVASERGSPALLAEHVALALSADSESRAGKALRALGISPESLSSKLAELPALSPEKPLPRASCCGAAFEHPLFRGLTQPAKRVLNDACAGAKGYRRLSAGPAQILLALLGVRSAATCLLCRVGVDLERLAREAESCIARGDVSEPMSDAASLSVAGKAAVERAREEAKALNQEHVGTEHVLLGLLADADCEPAGLLGAFGVNGKRIREQVRTALYRE
ncbi:MAG: hypothetical protein JXR37_04260 [Kiritimatiellae bacterium]|nr:hypothetical protein [Kiritimatiellia bacterium]